MFTPILLIYFIKIFYHNVIEEIKSKAEEEMYSGFQIIYIYLKTGVR